MNGPRTLWVIVLLGLALRIGVSCIWFDRLNDDVDNYRGIAEMLADGRGYSDEFTRKPTAFRPPLLPLLLAGILVSGGSNVAIATMQILLGTGTVLLTGILARQVLNQLKWLPPLIVALDPLSLAYTPQVMTEVLSAFTLSLLLIVAVREWDQNKLWLTGLTFGLAALCRPTVWAFLPLACLIGALVCLRKRESLREATVRSATFTVGAAVLLGPWLARNLLVLDAPVFATTHGGYTLLLGNNPEFYNKVARVSWKTIWDSEPWQESLRSDLQSAGVRGERASDRWMYSRAISNIRADPAGCGLSCLTRVRRLWSFVPAAGTPSAILKWGVWGFYFLVLLGLAGSAFCRLESDNRLVFAASWIMILAFTGVHLFYWANTRMRAPLIAPIAILSAMGWMQVSNRKANHAARQA